MRLRLALGVACLGLMAGPAFAQVQQSNPNAANESFALQSQFRTLNLQRSADSSIAAIQAQRNVQFAPPAPFNGGYPIVRHGHGSFKAGRGLNTSICTGC